MRVIAGKHRGRVLAPFRGEDIRPTPDRVKESLFQILGPRLAGARVLDLFCGSGALGLEALSRGAALVQFNDSSPESLALCRRNVALCGEEGVFTRSDYAACLACAEGPFDLIFADPPYRADWAEEILRRVAERELLAAGGAVIYESEREEAPAAGWRAADCRRYGRTKIVIFERE